MKALIVSTTLLATITLCLTLGVACGYAAITGVLRAFGHRSAKPEPAPLNAVQVGTGD